MTKTRILVAFEDEYRAYREFMAGAVRAHRPHVEVMVAGLCALGEEVARFDPDLVSLVRAPPGPRAAGQDLPGRRALRDYQPRPGRVALGRRRNGEAGSDETIPGELLEAIRGYRASGRSEHPEERIKSTR